MLYSNYNREGTSNCDLYREVYVSFIHKACPLSEVLLSIADDAYRTVRHDNNNYVPVFSWAVSALLS